MKIIYSLGYDLLYRANAILKSYLVKKNYRRLSRKFSSSAPYNNINSTFNKEWREKVLSKEKPIIYFVGTDESQDKGGLLPDLEELAELYVFTKFDKSYGQYSGLLDYEGIQGRHLNTKKLMDDIDSLIKIGKKPDLILMQAWGRSFEIDKVIDFKKRLELKFINISLDDRLVFEARTPRKERYNYGISGLAELVDLFLVSNPEVVRWYHGLETDAIYFPMASSSKFFYPIRKKKKYDVGFIGNRYGYRGELINYLRNKGISVKAYGKGWEDGYLESSKANIFFNECKVVLGIATVGHCRDFFTQKLRDFDVPLSGSVYITNNNRDLLSLYPDDEVILASTKVDFLRKIKTLLSDEDSRCEISMKAHQTALENHTYRIRFKELFSYLGINND